jgi:alpha-galactosidase
MNKPQSITIAYIGGGSRMWARGLMADLAGEPDLSGTIRLYDIDKAAAKANAVIGNQYLSMPEAKGVWNYVAVDTLEEALEGAQFVFLSILPGTYQEMEAYVHLPEQYGIFQSVGDTIGPAGILRGLMVFPMMVGFAKAIQKRCPDAWVINFTNPMSLCVRALYEGFPQIKAFGNCHEVFGTQYDLAKIYRRYYDDPTVRREDVQIDVSGVNHFTWITKASCRGVDLMPLYAKYVAEVGDPDFEEVPGKWKKDAPMGSAAKIKYDLFRQYGVIAAAGDRHLAEFFPMANYLGSEERRNRFKFSLTLVAWRVRQFESACRRTDDLLAGRIAPSLHPSGEEGLRQIKALLGFEPFITNVNTINRGQAVGLAMGEVVETNVYLRKNLLQPIVAKRLPLGVESRVNRVIDEHKLLVEAYRTSSLEPAFQALCIDAACLHLSHQEIKRMFTQLVQACKNYLSDYRLDEWQ